MNYALKLSPEQIKIILNAYQKYRLPLTNDYTIFRGKNQ